MNDVLNARRLLSLATSICCLALPMSAAAQNGDIQEMSRLNEEGFVEFRAGRYEAAAELFHAAYQARPDPGLQKNEAIAWFKAGRCDRAMPVANAFLISAHPSSAERQEARSIVANCRVEMAREAIAARNFDLAQMLLEDAESLHPDSYAIDQIAMARVQLAQARGEVTQAPADSTAATGATGRTVGWVLVGAGTALVAASVTYWVVTMDDARQPRWLVPVGITGGAALTGVGAFLVVTNRANRATPIAGVTYRW